MTQHRDRPMTDAQTVRLLTATVGLMLTNIEGRMLAQMMLTPVSEMLVTLRQHTFPSRITTLWETWSLMTRIYNTVLESSQRETPPGERIIGLCRESIPRTLTSLMVELEAFADSLEDEGK